MWTFTEVGGRPADVYEPKKPPRFGVLFLHDQEGETLKDRPLFTQLLEARALACVCPGGKRSWWVDRVCADFDPAVTAERYLLDGVMPSFAARWGLATRGVGLLGIGMGGQGVLRLAFRHEGQFPAVAAIAPALDFHELYGQGTPLDDTYTSKEQCRQDTAILHVPPHHYPPHLFFCIDPGDRFWFRGNDRLHEKLTALGIPHQFDGATAGGGHGWEYFDRMAEKALGFLYDGLVQESRRLL